MADGSMRAAAAVALLVFLWGRLRRAERQRTRKPRRGISVHGLNIAAAGTRPLDLILAGEVEMARAGGAAAMAVVVACLGGGAFAVPAMGKVTAWRAPGALPIADATAAARVVAKPE